MPSMAIVMVDIPRHGMTDMDVAAIFLVLVALYGVAISAARRRWGPGHAYADVVTVGGAIVLGVALTRLLGRPSADIALIMYTAMALAVACLLIGLLDRIRGDAHRHDAACSPCHRSGSGAGWPPSWSEPDTLFVSAERRGADRPAPCSGLARRTSWPNFIRRSRQQRQTYRRFLRCPSGTPMLRRC